MLARAAHGDEAFAVDLSNHGAIIGDKYIDSVFWREGISSVEDPKNGESETKLMKVPYIPTEKDMIDDLKNRLLQSQLVLTDTYEEKLELENKLTELQRAITEINERIGG